MPVGRSSGGEEARSAGASEASSSKARSTLEPPLQEGASTSLLSAKQWSELQCLGDVLTALSTGVQPDWMFYAVAPESLLQVLELIAEKADGQFVYAGVQFSFARSAIPAVDAAPGGASESPVHIEHRFLHEAVAPKHVRLQ